MQKLKALFFKLYLALVFLSAAYSLEEVMNTYRLGWLGVALTSWPMAAFFIRLFTDSIPRTETKLIPIHILAFMGVIITAVSQPNFEQIIFALFGFFGLIAYDFWYAANNVTTKPD